MANLDEFFDQTQLRPAGDEAIGWRFEWPNGVSTVAGDPFAIAF